MRWLWSFRGSSPFRRWFWLRLWARITRRCLCAVSVEERADFVTRHAWDHCCQGPGCNACWRREVGIHGPPSLWRWWE
jgi:hypothetical protein